VSALADILLGHPSMKGVTASADRLEAVLVRGHADAAAAWPDVSVAAEDFTSWIAARLAPREGWAASADVEDALSKLRMADLYLACACASGDARALAQFETHCMPEVARALKNAAPENVDETKQVLRRRFFVSEDGDPPAIAEYLGRGDLKGWVRAAAARASWRVARKPKGQTDVESAVFRAVAAAGDDLELDYLKRRYQAEFAAALKDAFRALPVRDRNVIRLYYGKGLSIDAIGAMHDVHRATVARWVNRIAGELVEATRKQMMERLGANRGEVSSLVRMLESRIDMALRAVVASGELSKKEDDGES